jgi:hypothetical protein
MQQWQRIPMGISTLLDFYPDDGAEALGQGCVDYAVEPFSGKIQVNFPLDCGSE